MLSSNAKVLRPCFASHNEFNDFLTAKLAHYNKWLAESIGSGETYPGYPEEAKILKRGPVTQQTNETVDLDSLMKDNTAVAVKGNGARKQYGKNKGRTKSTKGSVRAARNQRESIVMSTNEVNVKSVSKVSKKVRSFELYESLIAEGKAAVIEAYKNELGMSTAGATTYFYNAKKLCGSAAN
jgi:hypothetical protein